MAATEQPSSQVRKPVKLPPFGAKIGVFSKVDDVRKVKEDYLAAQEGCDLEAMIAAETQFVTVLHASSWCQDVVSEVRTLIEETEKSAGPTNALTSTQLDFAAQPIWQVPRPEKGEGSTDMEVIEAMSTSASKGGYLLAWFEALYRERGGGFEEGVGTFITPLLDLHTSDPVLWVAFKKQEFRWVHENFNSQGLAMSVNLFPTDFLEAGIVEVLQELHEKDAIAFKLLHVELLEHEDSCTPEIVESILSIHRKTGLTLAKDDVAPETLADPEKRRELIKLFTLLKDALKILKLDSSLVCAALNVPLVPRSFNREKKPFDNEVPVKRIYREAWAAGMDEESRKHPFPVKLVDSEHFTQQRVVKTYANKEEAVNHAAAVVEGFLEVSQALEYSVDIVAEVSVYANDFRRQLEHPIFGVFVKCLLQYAKKGKLFIQGSMGGGRAVSDAIVPHLVTEPVRDADGNMKALLAERQCSPYAGGEDRFHITENFSTYEQFGEAVRRVQAAGESLSGASAKRAKSGGYPA